MKKELIDYKLKNNNSTTESTHGSLDIQHKINEKQIELSKLLDKLTKKEESIDIVIQNLINLDLE